MPVDPSALAILSRQDERMAAIRQGRQQIVATSPEEKLQEMLAEASDTILPRVLSFAAGETVTRLLVANARILKADAAGAPLAWVKKPKEVAQSLKALITTDGPISVSPDGPSEEVVSDGAGVPGRDVLSYCRETGWFEVQSSAPNVSADQSFEEVLIDLSDASASLSADGTVENISGQDDLLPDPELLQELKREFDELRTADEAWLVLPVFGQDGHATGMYVVQGKTYVHVTASEGMPEVAAAWAERAKRGGASVASDRGDQSA